MASKLLFLFIALAVLFAKPAFGRGGGGRGGGGGGRGGGSRGGGGHGWGGGHSSGTSHGGGSHTYPSSNTGLSGSGGSHTYPSSGTGLSGGSRGGYGGGSHTYPSSNTGLSGSGGSRGYGYGTGYGNSHSYGGKPNPYQTYQSGSGYHPSAQYTPTYYHAPERVYVTEYRSSGSRYSDLLTGLAIYNLGRSHSHDHYYYHDTYSRSRYSDTYRDVPVKSEDEANCTLRVEEPGKVSHLKIPCEIVSTFASKNETTAASTVSVNGTAVNCTAINATLVNGAMVNGTIANCSLVKTTGPTVDPLSERGPPVSVTEQMRCAVEVRTRLLLTSRQVDCGELVRLSRTKEPEPEKALVPSRSTYKSWLDNPPWWLSIFFVV